MYIVVNFGGWSLPIKMSSLGFNGMRQMVRHSVDHQYGSLVRRVLSHGVPSVGRNGRTLSVFGHHMTFNLADGVLPVVTTKKLAMRPCIEELLWFMSGKTDNNILNNKKVNIWNGNATREFLDSRGLRGNRVGDLGPIYGHQWRHFNAPYTTCDADYTGKGVDQLKEVVKVLQSENNESRRIVMTAWNPQQLDQMALPPCHMICQFNVEKIRDEDRDDDVLSCAVFQRSGDVGLGVPFNIMSYGLLTHILATHCGLKTGKLHLFLGNAHIYEEHVEPLREQMTRTPYYDALTKVHIKPNIDIDDYSIDDIVINGYKSHPAIKMEFK